MNAVHKTFASNSTSKIRQNAFVVEQVERGSVFNQFMNEKKNLKNK
jgi:hypothetical protein